MPLQDNGEGEPQMVTIVETPQMAHARGHREGIAFAFEYFAGCLAGQMVPNPGAAAMATAKWLKEMR